MVESAPSGITIKETRLEGQTLVSELNGIVHLAHEHPTPSYRYFDTVDIVDARTNALGIVYSLAIGKEDLTSVLMRDGKEILELDEVGGLKVEAMNEDYSRMVVFALDVYTDLPYEAYLIDNENIRMVVQGYDLKYHHTVSDLDCSKVVFTYFYGGNTEVRAMTFKVEHEQNPESSEIRHGEGGLDMENNSLVMDKKVSCRAEGSFKNVDVFAFNPEDSKVLWQGRKVSRKVPQSTTVFLGSEPIISGDIMHSEASDDAKHYFVIAKTFREKTNGIFYKRNKQYPVISKIIYDGREIAEGKFDFGNYYFTPSLSVVAVETIDAMGNHRFECVRDDGTLYRSKVFHSVEGLAEIDENSIRVNVRSYTVLKQFEINPQHPQ